MSNSIKINKFADALVNKRVEKNMTKKEVAELFGWTSMYYGRYENGYLIPTKVNYKNFADFLEISIDDLKQLLKKD